MKLARRNIALSLALSLLLLLLIGCGEKGALSNSNAESAVREWKLKHGGFRGDGFGPKSEFTIKVLRIKEIPVANVAEGEAVITNLKLDDGRVGSIKDIYSGPASLKFERYNTGWVLKELSFQKSDGRRSTFEMDQPL